MIGQDQDTEKLVLAGMMSDKENLDQRDPRAFRY